MRGYHETDKAKRDEPMPEYHGEVGTLYVEKHYQTTTYDDHYQIWFEDFTIIGLGPSVIEALQDAHKFAIDLQEQVEKAMIKETK